MTTYPEEFKVLEEENKELKESFDTIEIMYNALKPVNKVLEEENKVLKELLGVAICPNAMNGCKDGILINPYGEQEQCYWCKWTKQALLCKEEDNAKR